MANSEKFDVIIIGSGIGGLACASLLATLYRKNVLVLERHSKLGGFTHSFKRPGGFIWDVGLHYVGEMMDGGEMRLLFDRITGGAVKWQPMPDPFEIFEYPGLKFDVPTSPDRYVELLKERFPNEKTGIDAYFSDVKMVASYLPPGVIAAIAPRFVATPLVRVSEFLQAKKARLARKTTRQVLESHIRDPKLRALLASQWGDIGLPPGESSFLIHTAIVHHYLHGGWYPIGGSAQIASSVHRIVEQGGGSMRTKHEVNEILVEGGRAVGVRVGEKEFRAPVVISDAGARTTYLKLLPKSVSLPFRDQLKSIPTRYTAVTLYLGLNSDPRSLGFKGENHWIYQDYDHDDVPAECEGLIIGNARSCYLSFPSLKDPEAKSHTAEIVAAVRFDSFARWQDTPWKGRGQDYQDLKNKISTALIGLVESRYPGFKAMIAFQELATPLSTQHFTGHYAGEIYGIPATPERLDYKWLSARTPIRGLFLTGSDVVAHGIVGALMGGVITVASIKGPGAFSKIFKKRG